MDGSSGNYTIGFGGNFYVYQTNHYSTHLLTLTENIVKSIPQDPMALKGESTSRHTPRHAYTPTHVRLAAPGLQRRS